MITHFQFGVASGKKGWSRTIWGTISLVMLGKAI